MGNIAGIDILVILAYLVITIAVGLYYARRKDDSSAGYFLAGRRIGWIAVGASLFATNISSEHFLGLAGYGASRGIAVGNFEWMAVIFLILLGWILAPIFINSKVFTVPEFFGRRFNASSRLYLAGVSICAYMITKITVTLFAGGLLLEHVFEWDMYTSAIIMLIITGLYTIIGGMSAVVYTSVIQAVFLVGGAVLLTIFGLQAVGGWSGLHAALPEDYFTIFKPASDPDFPWTGIVLAHPFWPSGTGAPINTLSSAS